MISTSELPSSVPTKALKICPPACSTASADPSAETALRAVTDLVICHGESKEDRSSIDVLRDQAIGAAFDAAENGVPSATYVVIMLAESSVPRPTRGARAMRSTGLDQTPPINMRDLNASNAMPTSRNVQNHGRSRRRCAGVSAPPELASEVGNEIMRQRSVAGATFTLEARQRIKPARTSKRLRDL